MEPNHRMPKIIIEEEDNTLDVSSKSPSYSIFLPAKSIISPRKNISSPESNVNTVPVLPALAVLPDRWINILVLAG